MKKFIIIISLIVIAFCPVNVFADNILINKNAIELKKGQQENFDITLDNAVGRIDITSLDENIASVSDESIFLDMENKTITINGNNVGTTLINVYAYDVSTYDLEDLTGALYQINVTVSDFVRGDLNNDNIVGIQDITILLKIYLNIIEVSDEFFFLADINHDGCIGISDIILLLNIYLGIE